MKEEKACNRSGAYIAPNATVVGAVSMGKDSSLWYQAVARGDHDSITIGEGSNIQDGCILHADAGFPVVIMSRLVMQRSFTDVRSEMVH